MSELWRDGAEPLVGYRIVRIGLAPDRNLLYARINERAEEMFSSGLIDETRELLGRYAGAPFLPALTSLGYRQAVEYLRGAISFEQAVEDTKQGHRNYAKRQFTWFRREPGVIWLEGFGDDPAIVDEAARVTAQALEPVKAASNAN